MMTFGRQVRPVAVALILTVLLSGARAFPRVASTECERNTSWSIWSPTR